MFAQALPLSLAAAALLALAGCVPPPAAPQAASLPPPAPAPANTKIAALLPLTGTNATVGRDMRQAVQLALGPDGPQPDLRDTGSTPSGATDAATASIQGGDTLIVGPLTQGETAAAATVANGTTPILAFTSDRQQGRPGVWPLGITPQQQVARLVAALTAAGKTRVAAVLPDNIFGDALLDGLSRATAASGAPAPVVRRYPTGRAAALDQALHDISQIDSRRSTDPSTPPSPPPFDALLLAETGPTLRGAIDKLTEYGLATPAVQIVGPALWSREVGALQALPGAWYAAPDPASRRGFEQAFTARWGVAPSPLADIAYDAAQLARIGAADPARLTSTTFNGVDGPLRLFLDGRVARGLAIFTVEPGGPRMVDPAPASLGPGS